MKCLSCAIGNPKYYEISVPLCCSIRAYDAIHHTDAPTKSTETRLLTLVAVALLSALDEPSSFVPDSSTTGSTGTASSSIGLSTTSVCCVISEVGTSELGVS